MLTHLAGDTYVLTGPVNIGLYIHADGSGTAVDTGLDDGSGRRLLKALREKGITLAHIINTHSHADHCGGNAFVQKRTSASIYATPIEAAIIENPYLEPFYLYGGDPMSGLQTKHLMAKASRVDKKIKEVPSKLGPLSIIPLPGHAPGQIGVLTPDNVLFCADAFFPSHTLDKYYLPYYAQVAPALTTLDKLMDFGADIYVPSHGCVSTDITAALTANKNRLDEITDRINSLLARPRSREQIVTWFYREQEINSTLAQYFLSTAAVSAHLTYLSEQGQIRPEIKAGTLMWVKN